MNPYLHYNPKHDLPDCPQLSTNRRKYQLDYIASKREIKIVLVGEAPGLDGCGYGGIAFTGEHNAVWDLGLPNHHGTETDFQKEQSANLIYSALKFYCSQVGISVAEGARGLYATNAIMCVPIGSNGRSITAPNGDTIRTCRDSLVRQLEIIRPKLVITLGANALNAVAVAIDLKIEGKLTQIVEGLRSSDKKVETEHGFELIPEIHPSPRNRVLGDLYTTLPLRLSNIFAAYLP